MENVTKKQAMENLHRSVDCESFIGLKECGAPNPFT